LTGSLNSSDVSLMTPVLSEGAGKSNLVSRRL